ncbi:MAG: phage Gp37/Gp68 family protein [Rhodocyclaceae bacterium]|nr:phage Gp37/Gp68 family protein [Rhodocyclaceae bacterium]
MSDKTGIFWTDATWNPVTGCQKVSSGCKYCYAERDWARLAANPKTRYYGRDFTDVQWHLDVLDQPLRWMKPRRIFVCSMSDLFHEAVPDLVIADVFAVMAAARRHTFQVLTKRPQRAADLMNAKHFLEKVEEALALHSDDALVWPLPNVEFGVTTENQDAANERVGLLQMIPAAVRWVSVEPLLGAIDFRWLPVEACASECCGMQRLNGLTGAAICDLSGQVFDRGPRIDWIVAAGESGPKARPMHPDWVRGLRDQCATASVPFLFKQWGEWVPRSACYHTFEDGTSCADRDPECKLLGPVVRLTKLGNDGSQLKNSGEGDSVYLQRIGKKAAGRLLDGREWNEYPVR